MHPTISVIVPVRDGLPLIDAQLDALAAQDDPPPFEVVVADNGSRDGTAEHVLAWSDRLALRVVDSSRYPGVSFARNAGAEASTAPLIAFCDADDVVTPGWVRAMATALEHADIVGGVLELSSLNDDSGALTAGGVGGAWLPVSMGYLPYAVGANLGCRREVFDEVGGFDLDYVGGHEEVDFAWRAQHRGRSIALAPDAVIAYRVRPDGRGLFTKHRASGRTFAQLHARFAGRAPIERGPLRAEARAWARLVRLLPEVTRPDSRRTWLTHAGWMAGRAEGWVRTGVRPPL